MYKHFSPLVVFTYLRFNKLKKLINKLKSNKISKQTEIIFFSDFAKDKSELEKVKRVRNYLFKINGFKKKKIILRKKNYGNGKNIIDGLKYVFKKHKSAIILEDDLEIEQNFLSFMNLCLNKYRNNKKVWHISGWNFDFRPLHNNFDVFFSRNMNCWGWGTWRDRWKYFEKKPDKLIKYFDKNLDKKKKFNLNNNLNYFGQILRNKNNKINTWAVFWYAQIFKNNGLCLSPNYSLVRNNGFDKFSSHSHPKHFMNIIYKTSISTKKNFLLPDKIFEYKNFYNDFDNFFNKKINFKVKLNNYLIYLKNYVYRYYK
tara:strand:+ start:2540 stop:3481 length:942 start_codon:yes stop_codon:yes gene_type:complete